MVKSRPSYKTAMMQPNFKPTHWTLAFLLILITSIIFIIFAFIVHFSIDGSIAIYIPFLITLASLLVLLAVTFYCVISQAQAKLDKVGVRIKNGEFGEEAKIATEGGAVELSDLEQGNLNQTNDPLNAPIVADMTIYKS